MGLFDERNELTHSDFSVSWPVATTNWQSVEPFRSFEATGKELERICRMVARGRLHGREDINARVQKLLAEYKVNITSSRPVTWLRLQGRRDDDGSMLIAKGNSVLADKQLARWKQHMKTIARRNCVSESARFHGKATIGVRVGKVLNKYKVGKHFKLDIRDDAFSFEIDKKKVWTASM